MKKELHEAVSFRLAGWSLPHAETVKVVLCGITLVREISAFTLTAFLFLPQIPV